MSKDIRRYDSLNHPKLLGFQDNEASIIGPPKGIGGKLKCGQMVFQGGYSPNSIHPLEKFKNEQWVQSFNPSGAKKDFNLLLESKDIFLKMYVGKNVCHGFTKEILKKEWEPNNKIIKEFWDKLKDNKAMHDVLAAKCLIEPTKYIWERKAPIWNKNKMSTTSTDELIFSLIGI